MTPFEEDNAQMQNLIQGLHRFQKQVYPDQQELFHDLAEGQNPSALFVTCADSRISPNVLTQTAPGELFILRNAGAMVPPAGAMFGGEAATVEYAVSVLKVQEIIVCGHSHCGAVTALLNPESVQKLTAIRNWLSHAETTQRIMAENYAEVTDPAQRLNIAIQEHVLVQIENLQTHPSVAAAIARGAIRIHGWVYKFETGEVFAFNPSSGHFESLGEKARRRSLDGTQIRDPQPAPIL